MQSRSVQTHVLWKLFAVCIALLPIGTGCSDDASDGGGGSSSSSSSGGAGGGNMASPLYAVFATTLTPDFRQTTSALVHLVPSLEAGTTIDYTKAIEFATHGIVFGIEKSNEFYVTLHDKGGVAKFTVAADGKASRVADVSFNAFGINALFNPAVGMGSPKRAYVFDTVTTSLITFDPSSMTIVGKPQKLADMAAQGFSVMAERFMTRVGDKLYFAFGNLNPTSFAASPKAGLVVIDTTNDAAKVVVDDRCGLYNYTHLAADGMLYTGPYPLLAAANALDKTSPAACIARFDPKTDTFDTAFKPLIRDLTGGLEGAGLVPSSGSEAYIKVYNPANVMTPPTTVLGITGAPAWELWKVDMTNLKAGTAKKVDLPPTTSSLSVTPVDGKTYSVAVKDAQQNSVLVDMSVDPPKEGIGTRGIPFSAMRVR